MNSRATIDELKRQLATLERKSMSEGKNDFTFGAMAIDRALGGLSRGALHEVLPTSLKDSGVATGFTLALAIRNAPAGPILWVRQATVDEQAGQLYPPGIAEFGFDPAQVILIRTLDVADTLYAAEEAVRCSAVGSVLVETWGRPAELNLTATRRLAFAAEKSGVTTFLIRRGAEPEPSASETRWLVRAAASQALQANAPGFPVFHLTLLRHRNGIAGREWTMEWVRDRHSFEERAPLSRTLVSLAPDRPAAAVRKFHEIRRAG